MKYTERIQEDFSTQFYLQSGSVENRLTKVLNEAWVTRSARRQHKEASTYNAHQKEQGQVYQVCRLHAPAGSTSVQTKQLYKTTLMLTHGYTLI